MQESFWWWQCSDRYIISLSPHLHTPPLFTPSLISLMVSVDVKHHVYVESHASAVSLLESRDYRHIKAINNNNNRVQELCESRGSRGLPVLMSLTVSVDVKQHPAMLRQWSQFVPNTSTDTRGHKALQNNNKKKKKKKNNNVHLSCAHQSPEHSHETY